MRWLLDLLGLLWGRVEAALWAGYRRIRKGQQELERDARQLGAELLDLVDDLPFAAELSGIFPVRNQLYGHGAFMGAAPSLLADLRWRRILAVLMPDVYQDVRAAVEGGAGADRIIPMFENNPVMAAYGVWRGTHARARYKWLGPNDLVGMEWDVFVDGRGVSAWERAGEADRPALIARLVDTMLIAHASSTDTVQEQLGVDQYLDVRKTPKTRMGGVESGAWMDLFARALALAEAEDLDASLRAIASEERNRSVEACVDGTFASRRPWSEAVARYAAATGRPHLAVVLENKSLRSTSGLLAALIAELNRRGVLVAAVGSFRREKIAGLSGLVQEIQGEQLAGPREILFLHLAGDLQAACDAGQIPAGQSAMFNGASLLETRSGARGSVFYRVRDDVLDELREYVREHALQIGLYVQEGDCDAGAASALSDLVHREAETFSLGFAWGGVLDEATLPSGGQVDRRGYGSQRYLEQAGRASAWKTRAERGGTRSP